MNILEKEQAYELCKEKYDRHEKILIQAYKSIKQKEQALKYFNEELTISREEIMQLNEEYHAANDDLCEKSEIISDQNITLRETLHNLRDTQSQLLQSEKMASLGILTAGVAHEINNPLNYSSFAPKFDLPNTGS